MPVKWLPTSSLKGKEGLRKGGRLKGQSIKSVRKKGNKKFHPHRTPRERRTWKKNGSRGQRRFGKKSGGFGGGKGGGVKPTGRGTNKKKNLIRQKPWRVDIGILP